MNKKIANLIYLIICALLIIVCVVLVATSYSNSKKEEETKVVEVIPTPTPKPEPTVKVIYEDKIVEVEKQVTSEMIREGINDMGVLITSEYYFTQVEEYTKQKTFLKYLTTEATFMYSYDGVVTAGIDCSGISVDKDDDAKKVTVTIPAADIQNIDIDFESFKVYEEKEKVWNKISIEDYNDSLIDFENTAKAKALEHGILERASKSAEDIIYKFVSGVVDTSEYDVVVEAK